METGHSNFHHARNTQCKLHNIVMLLTGTYRYMTLMTQDATPLSGAQNLNVNLTVCHEPKFTMDGIPVVRYLIVDTFPTK